MSLVFLLELSILSRFTGSLPGIIMQQAYVVPLRREDQKALELTLRWGYTIKDLKILVEPPRRAFFRLILR